MTNMTVSLPEIKGNCYVRLDEFPIRRKELLMSQRCGELKCLLADIKLISEKAETKGEWENVTFCPKVKQGEPEVGSTRTLVT